MVCTFCILGKVLLLIECFGNLPFIPLRSRRKSLIFFFSFFKKNYDVITANTLKVRCRVGISIQTLRRFNRMKPIKVCLLCVGISLEQQYLIVLIFQGKELFDQKEARNEDVFVKAVSGTSVKRMLSKGALQFCYGMTLKQT